MSIDLGRQKLTIPAGTSKIVRLTISKSAAAKLRKALAGKKGLDVTLAAGGDRGGGAADERRRRGCWRRRRAAHQRSGPMTLTIGADPPRTQRLAAEDLADHRVERLTTRSTSAIVVAGPISAML